MDEEIFRLIYISRAVPVPGGALTFLETARQRNERDGITGVLLRYTDRYLQYLEGTRDAVHACFDRIRRDPRHTDVHLLLDRGGNGRYFAHWRLQLLAVTPPHAALARRFFGAADPAPRDYCPNTGFELLYRLALG
jgi:hypothetical protein